MNERNYSEAFKKVEEFKALCNKSQGRVDALEREIARLTFALVYIDLAKHNMSGQVKKKNTNYKAQKRW